MKLDYVRSRVSCASQSSPVAAAAMPVYTIESGALVGVVMLLSVDFLLYDIYRSIKGDLGLADVGAYVCLYSPQQVWQKEGDVMYVSWRSRLSVEEHQDDDDEHMG